MPALKKETKVRAAPAPDIEDHVWIVMVYFRAVDVVTGAEHIDVRDLTVESNFAATRSVAHIMAHGFMDARGDEVTGIPPHQIVQIFARRM